MVFYLFSFLSSFKNVTKSQMKKSVFANVPLKVIKMYKADPISLQFSKFKSMYLKQVTKQVNKQMNKPNHNHVATVNVLNTENVQYSKFIFPS